MQNQKTNENLKTFNKMLAAGISGAILKKTYDVASTPGLRMQDEVPAFASMIGAGYVASRLAKHYASRKSR